MKYVNRAMLRRLPNGTIFAPVSNTGLVEDSIRMITGHYNDHSGFNGTMELTPYPITEELFSDNCCRVNLDRDFKIDFDVSDECDFDFDPHQLFAVYNHTEIARMIRILTDALVYEDYEK